MRVIPSLLAVALGATAIFFSTPTAQADESKINSGVDKSIIVCAAVFPCHARTFKLLEAFSNPSTFEGFFCKAKYLQICADAQKFKHDQNRKKRPGKKRFSSGRR